MDLHGSAPFRLQIGRKRLPRQYIHIVDTSPHDLIIGMDILQQLGTVTMCFRKDALQLHTRPLRLPHDSENVPLGVEPVRAVPKRAPAGTRPAAFSRVTMWEAQDLAPRTQQLVKAHTPDMPAHKDFMFAPSPDCMAKYNIWVAHSLQQCDEDGFFHVMVLNPLSGTRRLYAGTTLGTAEVRDPEVEHPVYTVKTPIRKTDEPPGDPFAKLDLSQAKLTDGQRKEMRKLLDRFRDIFACSNNDLGCYPDVEHSIDTGDSPPVHQRPYRIPASQQAEVARQFEEMLGAGVVEPSESPWSSPIVLVAKKTGEVRICADLRKVNAVTKPSRFPLPRIEDILDSLAGARYFSSLDLQSGYWQIRVAEQDRPKTAVITPSGLFQFVRMPFGLSGAPSTFQMAMSRVLAGLTPDTALVYLDDIVIRSTDFEQHLKDLECVFERLRKAKLKVKASKCSFAQYEINFLGHIAAADGLRVDPDKVRAISEMPPPTTITELRRFLGMCSYHRRFIAKFAHIAKPLFKLLRKQVEYEWREEQQKSFEDLKVAMTTAPVLAYPDPRKPYTLETDASGQGLGAVLAQPGEVEGKLQPVAYISRVLQAAEKNYGVTEQECLAVIWGLKQFRHYLLGQPFTVITDHQSLKWLMKQQSPNGRLARWALAIQEYEFEIVYRPGAVNYTADALSRAPLAALVDYEPTVVSLDEFRKAQREDPVLGPSRSGGLPAVWK